MDILSLKPGVFEAVEGMFAINAAIFENKLTIQDLADGLALAIKGPRLGDDGHDMAIVAMMMMVEALRIDKESQPCLG